MIERKESRPPTQEDGILLSTAKERYTRHVSCSAGKQMPNVSTSAISGSATMRVDKVTPIKLGVWGKIDMVGEA
ncbi:MAG: hypothetical protein SOU18_05100 [Alloprevotella sp.]|nr:hypothetical protein [Alloprevotella sp.]